MSNLEKVDKLVRVDLLQEKDQEQQDPKRIPLILTHNRFLPNLTAVVCKNWNILQTNKNLRELFQEHPITVFKRNKNLKEIIGRTRIENDKVKKSIFPLEQENALHVFRAQELDVETKCWQQTHLWANKQNKHLTFSLTLTVKVITLSIFFFFFLSRFSFTNIRDSQDSRGRGTISV